MSIVALRLSCRPFSNIIFIGMVFPKGVIIMGLIMAALSGFSSTLADTWQEYFVCESLPSDILVYKAKKQGRNKGSENVITQGSKIVVHEIGRAHV